MILIISNQNSYNNTVGLRELFRYLLLSVRGELDTTAGWIAYFSGRFLAKVGATTRFILTSRSSPIRDSNFSARDVTKMVGY